MRSLSEIWETPENRLIAACGRLHRAGVSQEILLALAEKENVTGTTRDKISALYKQFESGAGRGQLRMLVTSDNPKPVPYANCALSVTERHFIRLCGQALLAEAKAGGTAGAAQYIFTLGLRGDSADAVRDHLLEDSLSPAMMEIAGSNVVRDQLDVAANWYGLGREDAMIVA